MKNSEKRSRLSERLFESVTREGLIQPSEKILVAFSGGADSVALLLLLGELSERLHISLFAAHLNHGIRGEEADRDEGFCIKTCEKRGIPIETRHVSVPTEAKRTGEGLEECARRLRYAFLNECAAKYGCTKIATAHHADDNVETVLLHLIRGSGAAGLVGISPKRDNIIRPLLPFRKRELTEYLEEKGESFVFDSTNSDTKMTRNKIRHELLGTVYEINPRADAAFANTGRLLSEDNAYLFSLAREVRPNAPLSELKALPFPILSRFLQLRYSEYVKSRAARTDDKNAPRKNMPSVSESASAPQLSFVHLTPITDFIKNGVGNADFSLPGNVTAHVSARGAELTEAKTEAVEPFETPLKTGENNISQCRYKILITNDKNVAEEYQNIYKLSISASVNSATIFINGDATGLYARSLKEGDLYVYGDHKRRVRKCLINLKIPAYRRRLLPCICDKDGIIWVPGLRVADRARPQKGDDAVYIIYAEA